MGSEIAKDQYKRKLTTVACRVVLNLQGLELGTLSLGRKRSCESLQQFSKILRKIDYRHTESRFPEQ
jgi:hypothetical protein